MDKHTISGRTFDVASGFNLYIDTTSACNASCPFCIAPTIGRKDASRFFDGVAFALDLTYQVEGTVQVVGGEPMISKRFPELLSMIGEQDFRRVVVNTNGSRVNEDLVQRLKSSAVSCVNVSRHHYDEKINQELMRFRKPLSNEEFARNVNLFHRENVALRMQCNLIKGGVDSVSSMLSYIDWCLGLGCNEVSFSQLFPLGMFDYQVPIEQGYTEKHQIDLRRLVAEIDSCGEFLPVPEHVLRVQNTSIWGGSNYGSSFGEGARRRSWYGPKGTRFSLKTLFGYDEQGLPKVLQYKKEDDWELQDGLLAFAVVHSDGYVTASWDKRERVLFDPFSDFKKDANRKMASSGKTISIAIV